MCSVRFPGISNVISVEVPPFNTLYPVELEEGLWRTILNPNRVGSKFFSFSRNAFAERQYQDWCTKVTCAGSTRPITEWSIFAGKTTRSTCRNFSPGGNFRFGGSTF